MLVWLRQRMALAEREDYGTDLDECETLIEQFEQVSMQPGIWTHIKLDH